MEQQYISYLLEAYKRGSERQQHILATAALLHDVGKIPTSRAERDEIVASNHAPIGSRMAVERIHV